MSTISIGWRQKPSVFAAGCVSQPRSANLRAAPGQRREGANGDLPVAALVDDGRLRCVAVDPTKNENDDDHGKALHSGLSVRPHALI